MTDTDYIPNENTILCACKECFCTNVLYVEGDVCLDCQHGEHERETLERDEV
jgi:hypothetical protein